MPEESRSRSRSRRSVGYRTFITCEDPRGVAEFGTVRKPKITPTHKEGHGKKHGSDRRRKHKNLAKRGVEEGQGLTSVHLLEVSRGAQKLNNVVSSWSAGHTENNDGVVAHDLLQGALHLKDSLAMLSRCHHKLDHDNDDLHVFDEPSTSSRQSSTGHSCQMKKDKKPNLIAKLMGLEDASFRSLPYNPRKHFSKAEKILNQKKPAFDSKQRGSDVRPPIVILRPLRFSCVDLERPTLSKSRVETYDEMLLGMRMRTNPLAQPDECEVFKFNEAKARERTYLGSSKSRKMEFVDKNVDEAPKMNESGRKETMIKDKPVNMTSLVANCHQSHNAAMSDSLTNAEGASQTEITVADYANDEQSSSSETSLLFGKQRNKETALLIIKDCNKTDRVKLSHCHATDTTPIKRHNLKQLDSVCDHLANSNQSQLLFERVEELFDNEIIHEEISARELLDTANELVSMHSSRCSRSATLQVNRCCCSFQRLLDEVCDEIKVLARYKTAEGDNHHLTSNSILLLVKGDLRTRGMVGGMWDMGWMNGGSTDDEIQGITRQVQEMVLDGLVEEILF